MKEIINYGEARRQQILKGFTNIEECIEEAPIEKARHGVYADNAQNRRLQRVGQEYGHAAQEKPEAGQEEGGAPEANVSLQNHARQASEEALVKVANDPSADAEMRKVATAELERRGVNVRAKNKKGDQSLRDGLADGDAKSASTFESMGFRQMDDEDLAQYAGVEDAAHAFIKQVGGDEDGFDLVVTKTSEGYRVDKYPYADVDNFESVTVKKIEDVEGAASKFGDPDAREGSEKDDDNKDEDAVDEKFEKDLLDQVRGSDTPKMIAGIFLSKLRKTDEQYSKYKLTPEELSKKAIDVLKRNNIVPEDTKDDAIAFWVKSEDVKREKAEEQKKFEADNERFNISLSGDSTAKNIERLPSDKANEKVLKKADRAYKWALRKSGLDINGEKFIRLNSDDATEFFDKIVDAYEDFMDESDSDAVKAIVLYSADHDDDFDEDDDLDFAVMRKYLYGNKVDVSSDKMDKFINGIDTFISQNKVGQNIVLYRKLTFENDADNFVKNLKEGEVFSDKSFMSTTCYPEISNDEGTMYFDIIAPAGCPVAPVVGVYGGEEGEFLIGRDQNYKVHKIEGNRVLMEWLPEDSKQE